MGGNREYFPEIAIYGPGRFVRDISVTANDKHYVHLLNSLNQNNSRGAKIGARIKIH